MKNNNEIVQPSQIYQDCIKNTDFLTKKVTELNRATAEFYERIARELKIYKKALRLAVLTQCNKSRQDLINQICKFNFTDEVYAFFVSQAQKELEEDGNL